MWNSCNLKEAFDSETGMISGSTSHLHMYWAWRSYLTIFGHSWTDYSSKHKLNLYMCLQVLNALQSKCSFCVMIFLLFLCFIINYNLNVLFVVDQHWWMSQTVCYLECFPQRVSIIATILFLPFNMHMNNYVKLLYLPSWATFHLVLPWVLLTAN